MEWVKKRREEEEEVEALLLLKDNTNFRHVVKTNPLPETLPSTPIYQI